MITGFAIIAAFSCGMWVMKKLTLDYEDRIINAIRGREYSRRRSEYDRRSTPVPHERKRSPKPMLDEDDYDKLMREGHIEKRR